MSACASLPAPGLVSRLLSTIFDVPRRGKPTHYPPGTAGKIAVMAARFGRGEPVFHRDDATAEDCPATGTRELGRRDADPVARSLPKGITAKCRGVNYATVYRVRPWVRGLGLVQVGEFKTLVEAVEALKAFWRQQKAA